MTHGDTKWQKTYEREWGQSGYRYKGSTYRRVEKNDEGSVTGKLTMIETSTDDNGSSISSKNIWQLYCHDLIKNKSTVLILEASNSKCESVILHIVFATCDKRNTVA
jgi:hypothetical protein